MKKLYFSLILLISSFSFNAQCDYTILMSDSYGDGWQGQTLTVSVAGVNTQVNLPQGFSGTASIPSYANDVVTITLNGSDFYGEISFSITSPAGVNLGSYGPLEPAGVIYSGASDATCLPPSCLAPSGLTATNITNSSADLAWTENGTATAWEIEYGVTGFTATGSGTSASATTASISGLSAQTTYDFYVRATCSATDQSPWLGPYPFTTACAAEIPNYTQGFNPYPGNCWSEASGSSTPSGTSSGWLADGFGNVGNTGAARFNIWAQGVGDWLISPTFDLSNGGYEINLDVALTQYANTTSGIIGNDDAVYIMQSVDDGLNWTTIYTWDANNSPSNTGDNVSIDITSVTSATSKFAIFALEGSTSGGDLDFFIDNFAVRTPPSCLVPTALAASNLTNNSADISWTAGGTETSWNFDYGPTGYTQGQGTSTIAANPNSLFVGGANATWAYIHPLVLTTDGAASKAAQTYTINVTSLPASGAKARLIKSTSNGAAAFTPSATGQALVLGANTFTAAAVLFNRYVKIQFDNNQFEFDAISINGNSVYTSGTSVSTTSASLSGLNPNTSYDAYVQSDCGSGGVSSWAGPFSFTTNPANLSIPTCDDFESGFPGASTALNTAVNSNASVDAAGSNGTGSTQGVVLEGSNFYTSAFNGASTTLWTSMSDYSSSVDINVDATSESVVILTFDLKQTSTFAANYSNFRVTVNGTQIGSTINPSSASADPFVSQTYDLSAYAGSIFSLSLEHIGKYSRTYNTMAGDAAYIDNICLSAPNCLDPTALTASSITATTASVSWNGTGATSYNIEYGPNGYTQGTGGTASTVSATATIADNPNSLFLAGIAAWPHVSNLALTADGASSQPDQTFTINVTSLPTGGTNWRLIKQNQSTGASFVPTGSTGQPLVLGVNTLTAPASTWNRYVKAQFQNNTFEFDAISINGNSVYSSSNTSFTGLTPLTQYDVYVQSDCGSGAFSSWVGPLTISTLPAGPAGITCTTTGATSSVVFSDDFESNGSLWTGDANWEIIGGNGASSPGTGPNNTNIHSGSGIMNFEASNTAVTHTGSKYSPAIDLTAASDAAELSFWMHGFGADMGTFEVAVGDGPASTGTYTTVFTTTGQTHSSGASPWWNIGVDLTSYLGQTIYLKFTMIDDQGGFTGDMAIDLVEVSTCVSCSTPSLLTASNITSNSADISWTAGGTETAWNYEYGPVNFSQGSGTSSVLSSANTSLTGLTANTSYHAYVQADCGRGNTSAWVGPLLITTQCAIVSTFPFTEDFETTSTTASCWVNADASSNKIWTLVGGVAKFTASSGGPHTAKFVSPIFDMSSLTLGGQVSFDYKQLNWSGDQNELEVFYRISTTDSWVSIWSDASNVPVLTNITLDLPNISSTYQIAFQGTDNYGYANELDNIIVMEAPPCLDVTGVAALNITNNSADISWTSGPNAVTWDFEYGPANFSPGTGTLSTLTLGSISLTGLTANTSYDVYVMSDCGANGAGVNVGPFNFTTECDIVTTFPYTMDFENGFGCWDILDLASANTWQTNSGSGVNASISARIQYSSTAHNDYLISPKFSVTANSSRFSFNSRNGSSFYDEKFDVLLSTTGKAAADFTDTLATGVVPPTSYEYYQYDLSSYIGQDVFVSIHATEQDQLYLYVDDVTIDEFISKTIIQSETSCDSYTWSVNGTSYTSDTNLTVFSPAVDVTDADSTFILNLTVNSSTSITETITACDSLSWNGNTYFASDSTATVSLLTSSGCDSIVTLNLTINNSSLTSETNTVCDTYDWQGNTYTTSGNYSYSDTTVNGCDSTINLVLTVNSSSSSLLTTTACNTFTWKGSTFTSSGIYVAPAGTNFAGCPQVDSLDLTITTIATSDTQTACDSYNWNGNDYTTSGTYYSSSACVDTLYLTVNASSSSSSTVAACDSSVWNGITYFTSGTYNIFTTNAAGCDSIATLNLTVGNSATNSVTVSECDSYNWNGTTYTSSGVYSGVFQTSTGCDSTVNLVLTINSSSNQSVTVFSCDEYTWDGVSYTASGDYTNNYTTASGCDSTVTLVLTLGTTAAPFTEGFDINFPNCWSQPDSADGEDALDWTRNSFATLSQGTGPSDDVIGGGHYMYIESSLPAQHGDNAVMYTNLIDISSLTNPELRFFSHMYGESTGSLTVEIQGENDTVPTTIFTKSGDHGDLWVQERVSFTSTSNRVKFKITGVLDSNSLGAVWAGDMAIDEFGVREAVPNDLAIIAAAVNSDCELTTTEPIELWVVNNGLVDQGNFKLSYSINGGAPVLDSINQLINIGDTLKHIFNATADMSTDGIYDIDFACLLTIDADVSDNVLNFVAENYTTPEDAVTLGDTICFVGDVGQISAISDGWIYWYDSLVGGSLVGENDTLYVTPSATTSYFAEVSVYDGFEEDFESYSPGDLIAQSSNDWNTWSDPNGGADDDAEVTDFVSSGGSNSLYLNDDNSDDIVLPLGKTYSSGTFNFETDMYIETEAYFNFQEGVVNGEKWAFDLYFTETEIKVEIDDSTVLTVAYSPNNPLGAPVWFNFGLEADLDNGQWKMIKDGVSIGAFSMSDEISSVNFWASTGNNYYIDNVEWGAWGGDACRSLSRTEAVVVLDSCNTTTVSEVSFENLKIYPNPNNGSFTIANSEPINGVVIMDLRGKVVYRNNNLNLYNLNVDLENLDRGMYVINIISENEITTKSIIVN